jgi:predicted transcriptional regulator
MTHKQNGVELEISEVEYRILVRIQKEGNRWRYAKSIAKEVGISLQETFDILGSLESQGIIENKMGAKGQIWTITDLGKSVQEYNEIEKYNKHLGL